VVIEVKLDGQTLGEQDLATRREEAVGQREVRMASADPKLLAIETLEQVRDRLRQAGEQQAEAADLLQQDQPVAAYHKVGESIEGWLQVQQAVLHSAVLLGINLDNLVIDGQPAHVLTTKAVEQIGQVKDHLQNNDPVALADALAYEWPELTEQWDRLIKTLIEAIKPGG
jgi:hypothetical protein